MGRLFDRILARDRAFDDLLECGPDDICAELAPLFERFPKFECLQWRHHARDRIENVRCFVDGKWISYYTLTIDQAETDLGSELYAVASRGIFDHDFLRAQFGIDVEVTVSRTGILTRKVADDRA